MACQLLFLNGNRAGQRFSFEQQSFWLGRDPSCELAFEPAADLTVSARHLQITLQEDRYYISDTSTNGTLINGQPLKQGLLTSGDVIELGRGGPQLRFQQLQLAPSPGTPTQGLADLKPISTSEVGDPRPAVGSALPAPASLPKTASEPATDRPIPTLNGSQPTPASAPPADRPAPTLSGNQPTPSAEALASDQAAGTAGRAVGVVLTRIPDGQPMEFHQQVIRIGRDPTADFAFDPQTELLVSYNHAKIMVLEGTAVLIDTESTNGIFVNGRRVSRLDLHGGETLELGLGGPRLRVTLSRHSTLRLPEAQPKVARDGTIFGCDLPPVKALSLGEAALLGEYPLAEHLAIGRDADCAICLDSMYVSKHHAAIEKQNGGYQLKDAGSANGTYLNGKRISSAKLTLGTEFVVGPYFLKYTGSAVRVFDTRTKTWIDAFELSRTDPVSKRNFLDRVSLKILPGEFVCILGPSGCGKSTLLKSLNGMAPADAGAVKINNIDFYSHYQQLKHQVGYVPQDDIIHPQLSVWRTLYYAARLRLPSDTTAGKREERIRDVLSALELYDHRHKPIHRLSGGQRKRVSIAVELLTDPAVIYLDEPTSGLDPNLEEKMMLLLREMTLRGKTVATVTHTLNNIQLADKLTFLVDGRLVFFGSPQEARTYFDVQQLPDVYKRFEERKGNADALRGEFEASPLYAKNIHSQLNQRTLEAQTDRPPRPRRQFSTAGIKQFWLLTCRYAEILTRDLRNTTILLAQAPLVALFICLAVQTDQPERGPTSTMFLIMSLSALWFGCANAAREITKEAAIFARERMVNLRIIPYVASKFFVLQWIALLQVTAMLLIVHLLRSGYTLASPPPLCTRWGIQACSLLILDGVPGDFGLQLLNLYLTALNGIGLGLLVSALAGNSDKAMSLVPLVLIPQVLFSGSFGIAQPHETFKRAAGYVMSLNWSLDQAKRIALCSAQQEKPPQAPGSGCATCLHAYDPYRYKQLGTEDQEEDARCAALLPVLGQLTEFPEHLELVEDGLYTPPRPIQGSQARESTRAFTGLVVLAGMTLTLFLLVCLAMRFKDRKQN